MRLTHEECVQQDKQTGRATPTLKITSTKNPESVTEAERKR